MGSSVLDDLGEEVTGIVAPVSLCMALTVLLVRLLNPDGVSSSSAVAIAQTVYHEQAGDSTGTKLEGALLNALIFVAIVGAMTFVLFLMFKYGCDRCIYAYMAFAAFSVFFLITGTVLLELVQLQPIPVDALSFSFVLWNFSVVGTVTMFTWPAPILMKQGYMVATGVIMAFLFTGIPEWTTWTLLVAMALYDILAVLTPGGPLKLLVELAQERDADIPAMVYEARSTGRRQERGEAGAAGEQPPRPRLPRLDDLELADQSSRSSNQSREETPTATGSSGPPQLQVVRLDSDPESLERSRLGPPPAGQGAAAGVRRGPASGDAGSGGGAAAEAGEDEGEGAPLMGPAVPSDAPGSSQAGPPEGYPGSGGGQRRPVEAAEDEEGEGGGGLPDAIKLGMGDFIFYSVLVGRAAMYDLLTVFAAYLAIVAGLGATLLLLALFRKALPALPISVALGVSFYFFARLVLEPVLLPLSLHLLYF